MSGKTLAATGAATLFGDFQNNGTVNGPSGLTDFLVFEDMVTGTGQTTGNIKYNGGHNPGVAAIIAPLSSSGEPTPSLLGDPLDLTYHVTVIDGNLGLGSRNVLTFDVGGYGRGTSFDGLTVTGNLWLDGQLQLLLTPDFMPDQDFSYDFIDAGNFIGSFASFDLPALSGGYQWDTSQVNTTGVIFVVPEPSTVLLLGLAAALLAGVGRLRKP